MDEVKQNYYGSLCSDMYEILHKQAPQDELNFYLSYAEKGKKILEPLCGSGRFLIPFLERGFDIYGIDLSKEMLDKLIQKAPNAQIIHSDIANYTVQENFDYIFIPSGSISLFTDMSMCKSILQKMKNLLTVGGKFVFAVDTVFGRHDDNMYKVCASVKTKEGYELILKMKNRYDEDSQTQFSPSVYELYNGTELLKSENMDFQTHLYRYGEMEEYLRKCGFKSIVTYSNYQKELANNDECEIGGKEEIAKKAEEMAKTVKQAIETYGTTHIWGLGDVYAYEVDGFGQYNLMDDANVPSLLAMSYLGYEPESQEVADNTRKLILSEANPFYYAGTKLSGIGSPHTPVRYVWHISKAIEGLTAPTKEEKHQMIHELMATDGGTGLMHEGVFVDDPTVYTREWFSWANAMFCELVMQYCGYEIKK